MASPPNTGADLNSSINNNVKKYGYLKKQKHGHKRFFVLKGPSDGCPARLEYYDSEKKWKNKSAAKRVIPLDFCLNINKRADAKYKHLIALYTKDEYFAVAAENEQEQEEWHGALTDLMTGGKVYDGSVSNSASSLVGFEDANYGMITPVNATYKEVWQVNLKSRGLGQSKNLTGVYRLCLSSRTISFVKLNSEVASVVLQLMNIRRCGHSDSFFFIELGRSASTGPGELWMQADDSVVAQNIHETILEAMKAMKELSEFRPRSKSQSSGTNPISVPTRRHLNNLPPSQTGLLRRSRTDSVAATSPVNKFASCRIRTASEGDGTMTRPMSVSGSPLSPCSSHAPLSRSNTLSSRACRMLDLIVVQPSKSVSMPVCQSPPAGATSPTSLSSSSGNGSTADALQRPPSGSASMSGSPSDTGFMSCEEYSSSPGDLLTPLANRSNTPEYMGDTPPSCDGCHLQGYMMMERQARDRFEWQKSLEEGRESEKAYRKRTYSLTTPAQQRVPPHISSTSLDEYTLMRATRSALLGQGSRTASPKMVYPEDYSSMEIGSLRSSGSNLGEDGYMPMSPGVALPGSRSDEYMVMSPRTVSAPKEIVNPRVHPQVVGTACRVTSPSSCSLDDSGYMRMWAGCRLSVESSDGNLASGEYMNVSPVEPCVPLTPPPCSSSSSLLSRPQRDTDTDGQYVMMSPRLLKGAEEADSAPTASPPAASICRLSWSEALRARPSRPARLSLDAVRTLPSMCEHPPSANPRSPSEYVNVDFGEAIRQPLGSLLHGHNPHSSPSLAYDAPGELLARPGASHGGASNSLLCPCQQDKEEGLRGDRLKDDYTEMSFRVPGAPPQSLDTAPHANSPSSVFQRLTLADRDVSGVEAYMVPVSHRDPDRGAKVIRADPQGRRRHSSETFSSTTTVTPVFPSFAHDSNRHGSASVENVSAHGTQGSEEGCGGSPMCRETSAGFQNGLNYIALNLMDDNLAAYKKLLNLNRGTCCKGDVNGLHGTSYVSLAFKETTAAVTD